MTSSYRCDTPQWWRALDPLRRARHGAPRARLARAARRLAALGALALALLRAALLALGAWRHERNRADANGTSSR